MMLVKTSFKYFFRSAGTKSTGTAILAVLLMSSVALADSPYRIKLLGRPETTVTSSQILLGDIAQITGEPGTDDAVIALKKIVIDNSPKPGAELSIDAAKLLEKLRAESVDLQKLGYSLPRALKITRASRALSAEEVRAPLEAYLKATGSDVVIKQIDFPESANVYPGTIRLEVKSTTQAIRGKIEAQLTVQEEGQEALPLSVTARLDQFLEMPVAAHSITKGNIVESDDVMMARVNLSQLPSSASPTSHPVVGMATSRSVSPGELLHDGNLKIPPLVVANSPVTIIYKSGALEATATGTALDSGIKDSEIRVRNEQSKKIFKAKVLESGLVGVNP